MGEGAAGVGSTPSSAAQKATRLPIIDAARGVAVLAMIAYHFSWDLRYFGYIAADVEGALPWRIFAHATAGAFLFLVGVGLVLSTRRGLNWKRYLRRLGVIAAAAAAITAVTWFIFPDSYIFFGVLHHIAVASVLGLLFLRMPVAFVVGATLASFLAPVLLAAPLFDTPALMWLGLGTYFPRTNDYVPLFPWFGAVLAGIATTRLWLLYGPRDLPVANARLPSALLWAGRHSLLIYLLHQPLLFGAVYAVSEISPPDYLAFENAYLRTCVDSCVDSGIADNVCQKTCACAAERSQEAGLWAGLMRQSLAIDQERRYFGIVDACRAAAEGR